MKIDNSIQSLPNVSANDGKKRTGGTSAAGGTENANSNVHISPQAANMQSVDGSLANEPVVDMARVQEIKQAISDGTFKVNSEVVADRLLETVEELLQSKGSRS